MGELAIETVKGRTAFEPGEAVELIVGWSLEHEPEAVEVRLAWTTRGKGSEDMAVVWRERFERPQAIDGRRLAVELPLDPYSFSGKLVSLVWFFEIVVFPSKEARQLDIAIGPGAREVLLYKAPPGGAPA
ncbi:MAG: hypothetical protein ACUVYA_03110 [Planctomycetota bacterium]